MAPYTVKWGIMATGGIATTFAKDLLNDPATREVSDVAHTIVAAASSSSKPRAESFLKDLGVPGSPKAYGSYAELVADEDVQIVYVATPHSHHFQNAMLCLEAGKNVLCEKALTVNASQARKLVDKAREKKLFFMEAVWTRYFPLSIKIREMITSKEIGDVYRVLADNSFNSSKPDGSLEFPDDHRMVNVDLAGGALLDLGIYSLTWLFQTLYHLQPGTKEKPLVVASMNKYDRTGADESTAVVVSFPQHKTMGIATTSLRAATELEANGLLGPSIRIQGSEGEIQVMGPPFKPRQYRVLKKADPSKLEVVDCPIPQDPARNWGHGMFWEADECARCLRDGKLESATLPWSESVVIMEVMEEALKQGGIVYPEVITTDVYDPKSPLNTGKA
ncbi:NAD(P)-binding protein [Cryphonectria parasitica EP155]|uniref:D-xylose 1-dehydrogenase (NADP(+), D-xylono-1,5-lactone-forming) n=1 Tax=Cryphonectria parasitica (strain ATCC 38755 / EP155) TaxID=660469 RepID=A0A9P4Y3D9_CRYP1|nr:NAD(P)-binding protein [Cryphonectria parasitica EP155]KAF3765806.1 NAD(P)-binding protein [Cryphonectria parasitica EP155]